MASPAQATDMLTIARVAYLGFNGYDSSGDLMNGPVGALIAAVEAGTLYWTVLRKKT